MSNHQQDADIAATLIEFTPEQIDRLGHWLSECLDDAAPLNERIWRGRAKWMVMGPTFQGVMREVLATHRCTPVSTGGGDPS